MLHDCCLFATLKHSTINSPLGIVHKENLSPYPLIIYPYSQRGILKRFLIHNRTSAREQVRVSSEEKKKKQKVALWSLYLLLDVVDTRARLHGHSYRQRLTLFTSSKNAHERYRCTQLSVRMLVVFDVHLIC